MSVRREFRFVMHIEKTGTSSKTSVVKYPQHHKKNRSQQVFFILSFTGLQRIHEEKIKLKQELSEVSF